MIRCWRAMKELDLRTAAKMMGTDAATLLRIEQGKMPSASTLICVLSFIFEPAQEVPKP